MGGRFGKYGEFKRKQQLRKGKTAVQQSVRGLKKSPKVLPKPIPNEPAKEKK
jgi:hypothetical protein